MSDNQKHEQRRFSIDGIKNTGFEMDTAAPSYGLPCPLSFIQREAAALKNEPPLFGRMKMYLLYDGFFSFAVVRQISIDTFLKVPLLLLVTLFLLQLLYRYIL